MTNQSTTKSLAVTAQQEFWTEYQLAALRQVGIENAPQADLAVFLNFAQRTGLDPFARQIYMIGRRSKAGDNWITKWTIQASIDGLRIVAERSRQYTGQVGPEFCGPDGVWKDVWVSNLPPVAARVGVLRSGFDAPLYSVAYWDEYVQTDRDGNPTSLWKSKPKLMLAKCAEALALRKAFPNDLAGLYTADEMAASENPTPPVTRISTTSEVKEIDEVTGEILEDPITAPQVKLIQTLLTKLGYKEQTDRHDIIVNLIGRDIEHLNQLTKKEAIQIIDDLKEQISKDAIG